MLVLTWFFPLDERGQDLPQDVGKRNQSAKLNGVQFASSLETTERLCGEEPI